MHEQYQPLLKQYQLDPVLLAQVQELMGQVFKKLSQDAEQEEMRLKAQFTEEQKKHELQERRYAFGEIEKEIYLKFSGEVKKQVREIELQLEKLSVTFIEPATARGKGLNLSS